MKKTNNIIKINGRHYDANTGDILNVFEPVIISDIKPARHSRHSISVKALKANHPKPKLSNDVHRVVKTVRSHAPQSSKTLMRGALKKPLPTHKHAFRSQGAIDMTLIYPKNTVLTKLSVNNIDDKRLKHATAIPKSKLISHFNSHFSKEQPTQPALTPAMADIKPRMTAAAKPDFLQVAIDRATSHLQPPHKPSKKRRFKQTKRIAKIGVIAIAVSAAIGFLGIQNMPKLQLHLASSKAGFAASLPAYKPLGFKLATISSNTGEVAVKFSHIQDLNRNYTLVEKPSTLNSSELRDTFVIAKDINYQTELINGQTVYLYNKNSATWVNGNIWYVINGNGSLTNSQIFKLVTSV